MFLEPDVQIDFNAIKPGIFCRFNCDLLDDIDIHNYLIEVGGEIKGCGVNEDNKVWKVGIDKPLEEIDIYDRFQFILELDNKSLVLQVITESFYEKNGVKYSHTINPMTGYPVQNRLLSVTVMTNKCSLAKMPIWLFMAMGVEKTKKLVNLIDDQLDVYLIYTDKDGSWKTYISPGKKNN